MNEFAVRTIVMMLLAAGVGFWMAWLLRGLALSRQLQAYDDLKGTLADRERTLSVQRAQNAMLENSLRDAIERTTRPNQTLHTVNLPPEAVATPPESPTDAAAAVAEALEADAQARAEELAAATAAAKATADAALAAADEARAAAAADAERRAQAERALEAAGEQLTLLKADRARIQARLSELLTELGDAQLPMPDAGAVGTTVAGLPGVADAAAAAAAAMAVNDGAAPAAVADSGRASLHVVRPA